MVRAPALPTRAPPTLRAPSPTIPVPIDLIEATLRDNLKLALTRHKDVSKAYFLVTLPSFGRAAFDHLFGELEETTFEDISARGDFSFFKRYKGREYVVRRALLGPALDRLCRFESINPTRAKQGFGARLFQSALTCPETFVTHVIAVFEVTAKGSSIRLVIGTGRIGLEGGVAFSFLPKCCLSAEDKSTITQHLFETSARAARARAAALEKFVRADQRRAARKRAEVERWNAERIPR